MNISIIGAGEIGQAIAHVLSAKPNYVISLWDKDPAKVPDQKDLVEIIPPSDFIFLCIPSWVIQAGVESILPHLKPNTIVISLAKGIEREKGRTMDELLTETLPTNQPFALLAGPMLAEELKADKIGLGMVATAEASISRAIIDLFSNTNLKLEPTDDVHGTALASVLKNVYSLALGIADGLEWNDNLKGWLAAQSFKEMLAIGQTLGAQKETLLGSAGMGDFIATGFSKYSLNREVGNELVKSGQASHLSEGLASLPNLLNGKLKNINEDWIVFNGLKAILLDHAEAKNIFESLC